jgi:hypothetical protein
VRGERKITVEITAEDFIKTHYNLVRLLRFIKDVGGKGNMGEGVTTRMLCDQVFNSRAEGLKVIREAEIAGYLHRFKMTRGITTKKKRNLITGKNRAGRYYVMNALTPAGKKLLASLE